MGVSHDVAFNFSLMTVAKHSWECLMTLSLISVLRLWRNIRGSVSRHWHKCRFFMPPTLKKLEGHIAFGLSVCVCVRVYVC